MTKYTRGMVPVTRMATAAVLALAVAVLPVMLDRCSESCEAHEAAAANVPACHHATTSAVRISAAPLPCGHDHNGAALSAAERSTPTGRSFGFLLAVVELPASVGAMASDRTRPAPAPPGPSALWLDHRSLPLRV